MASSFTAWADTKITIAVQPTFGAHQQIGYEIIDRLPEVAKTYGITDLEIETVKTKSSIDGNSFLLNKQIDVNVGSISSFFILNSKAPEQSVLLSAIGHYKYFLLCRPEIQSLTDVRNTKILLSSRNTLEAQTLRWLAQNEFNDYTVFEKNIVVMPRPQIYQMIKADSKDAKCVMTGAPLQNQLLNEFNLQAVAESDVDSGFAGSYNAYWARKQWAEENPGLASAFIKTAQLVLNEYNTDPKPILSKFIEKDNLEISVDTFVNAEKQNQAQWHSEFKGAQFFSDFLYNIGYLTENKPDNIQSVVFEAQ